MTGKHIVLGFAFLLAVVVIIMTCVVLVGDRDHYDAHHKYEHGKEYYKEYSRNVGHKSEQVDGTGLYLMETPSEVVDDTASDDEVDSELVACTMDAMQCPDGSYVGRIGPDCAFAPCPSGGPDPAEPTEQIGCAADAMECSDGSYVSRVAPNCEFASCPNSGTDPEEPVYSAEVIQCDSSYVGQDCPMNVDPVCASVQVQCITTPCDPVLETFSNACAACSNRNIQSYTVGECAS